MRLLEGQGLECMEWGIKTRPSLELFHLCFGASSLHNFRAGRDLRLATWGAFGIPFFLSSFVSWKPKGRGRGRPVNVHEGSQSENLIRHAIKEELAGYRNG